MDPTTDLPSLLEDLEANIDDLTTTLTPLLPPTTISTTASTLPLLSKAKLHTLAAYAIESLLFSALLTSGADAKSHAVFPELARLKGYFAKIKGVEEQLLREAERETRSRVDVGAAQRFIRHGLSGNERFDEMRRERERGERERAVERARGVVNRTFEDEEGEETPRKRGRVDDDEEDEEDVEGDAHEEAASAVLPRKKRGRPSKKDRAATTAAAAEANDTPTRATRSSAAPKTRSEAFDALASGSPAKAQGKAKGKAKGKGGKGK